MELYKLNLHRPLEYQVVAALTSPVWEGIAHIVQNLNEGAECIAEISEASLLTADDQGPHALFPLPEPLRFGTSALQKHTQNNELIMIPQGTYIFTQHRWTDPLSAYEALDWFIRESWWQRETAEGPFYVRWVREDGKTALQILRKQN
ncbi:MAG TPA: hypothetical protein P5519_09565 [Spirochaetia bacterium]|nr:hypothetical protein [Spirochaetales bacterium]HRS66115.1 hypothetical protein [Spirochaetia bacterium]HOT59662.1 hypothetical protein [Spirochaetales bacterium]HPD80238.1 hypothetical protein [Spirochaetales bacterium]HQG41057.1 hypothetical protein [Spirochaetales bacterium]